MLKSNKVNSHLYGLICCMRIKLYEAVVGISYVLVSDTTCR